MMTPKEKAEELRSICVNAETLITLVYDLMHNSEDPWYWEMVLKEIQEGR